MTMKPRLTKNQEKVLRHLYEQRESAPPTKQQIAASIGMTEATVQQALTELRELGMVGGPASLTEQVSDALRRLDPQFGPTSEGWAEHVILFASTVESADESLLAEELGYDKDFVFLVGGRLRAAGVWRGNKLSPLRLKLWENDWLVFWIDGGIAAGLIRRAGGTDENPQYEMTQDGHKRVSALGRRDT